jgi:hypothetical protein
MSNVMNEVERENRLYCTPPQIVKALLKREPFPGAIREPAAGKGHIAQVLRDCGYRDVFASDINDWGLQGCQIEDFLASTTQTECVITNPPFHLKREFLAQAKRLARYKIALLLPVGWENTLHFVLHHESDAAFPWKAMYIFLQPIPWENCPNPGGKMLFAWYVFERGYRGPVLREKIRFQRNRNRDGSRC